MDAAPVASSDDPADFYPGRTRRVTALVARSKTVGELVMHPTPTALYDHHLGPNCERYHLHVTAAREVGPGARSQILHREEDTFPFFELPRPNLILATMWAITDFTADNGTLLHSRPLLPAAGFDLIDPPFHTAAHELRERQIHVPGTASCSDEE